MFNNAGLAEQLIQKWWDTVRRIKNKEYNSAKECWEILCVASEVSDDLKSLGYTCVEGQWIHPGEAN
jgi:hypothetical protein